MPFVEYDEVEAICADCGRTFRSEEALATHREDSHAGRVDSARKEPQTCALCRRTFPSVVELQNHIASAHSKR